MVRSTTTGQESYVPIEYTARVTDRYRHKDRISRFVTFFCA